MPSQVLSYQVDTCSHLRSQFPLLLFSLVFLQNVTVHCPSDRSSSKFTGCQVFSKVPRCVLAPPLLCVHQRESSGQLGIPQCILSRPATAVAMAESTYVKYTRHCIEKRHMTAVACLVGQKTNRGPCTTVLSTVGVE